MRILYVAKHGSGGNDDEGAIAYALEQLGHEVVKVQEFGDRVPISSPFVTDQGRLDFCLFHKWANIDFIKRIKIPKAFWFWDLVDWPSDITLKARCDARKRWMSQVVPLVDLGFCSDGDWVAKDTTGKLRVLRQGADERIVGFGKEQPRDVNVLFVGIGKGGGRHRESFVDELHARYGSRLLHVVNSVYREDLKELVARSKVVVCPDSPVTNNYWSNRIYIMAGFGGLVYHPEVGEPGDMPDAVIRYPKGSVGSYIEGIDKILTINYSEHHGKFRRQALEDVKRRHLYRHRCEELVRVVNERLGI